MASVTDTSLALQDIAGFGSELLVMAPNVVPRATTHCLTATQCISEGAERLAGQIQVSAVLPGFPPCLLGCLILPALGSILNYFLERSREGRQGGPWDLTKGCWRWEGTAVAWGLGSPQSPHWVDCLVGFLQEEKNGQFGEMRCLATLSPEGTAGTSMGLSETFILDL